MKPTAEELRTFSDLIESILEGARVRESRLSSALPFSFRYGNTQADMTNWERTISTEKSAIATSYHVLWTDPATRLRVSWDVVSFARYPAIEYVLHLTNSGNTDSLLIEKLMALDLCVAVSADEAVFLHTSLGGTSVLN